MEKKKNGGVYLINNLVTFIIDGAEQQVSKSKFSVLDGRFYSVKKEKHTINIIVVVTVNGHIIHLSSSYPGSINDNEIVKTEMDWLKNTMKNENGLGDSGFDGLEEYHIFSPPSNVNEMYSLFSSLRIIVEQKIEAIKNFGATHHKIRLVISDGDKILRHHHQCWVVGTAFVNRYHKK